jgi:hypothetical protein
MTHPPDVYKSAGILAELLRERLDEIYHNSFVRASLFASLTFESARGFCRGRTGRGFDKTMLDIAI